MQPIATQCNPLQPTATQCNPLQPNPTAVHCNTVGAAVRSTSQGETPASSPRPGRVRFFKCYRAPRVRSASWGEGPPPPSVADPKNGFAPKSSPVFFLRAVSFH
eukprot:gene16085-biopygen2220